MVLYAIYWPTNKQLLLNSKHITYGKSLRSSTLSLTSSSDWSVSCHSTWQPSSFFFNASFEEAEIIFCLIGDDCGDQTMKVNLKSFVYFGVHVMKRSNGVKIEAQTYFGSCSWWETGTQIDAHLNVVDGISALLKSLFKMWIKRSIKQTIKNCLHSLEVMMWIFSMHLLFPFQ